MSNVYLDAFLFGLFTKNQTVLGESFGSLLVYHEPIELCDESIGANGGETSSMKAGAGLANIIRQRKKQ